MSLSLGDPSRFGGSADQTSAEEKSYQAAKYAEIIEILLSAGYFRARISGLSEFDKVVGGLCWCITSSGEDIDVDILFQENSTIGQKIKLSETIVAVLRKMHCPHPLQAHQIQGSDFPALFPVIVWLVKKFFENREATFQRLRKYAQLSFDKDYELPEDLEKEFAGVAALSNYFKPSRKYRRDLKGGKELSEESRVNSCLMEYGESVAKIVEGGEAEGAMEMVEDEGAKKKGESQLSLFEKKLKQAQKDAEREEEELRKQAEQQLDEIMQEMREEVEAAMLVSGQELGRIVGLQSDEISSAAAGYDEFLEEARRRLEEGRDPASRGTFAQVAAFKRQKQALEKEIGALEQELNESHAENEEMKGRLDALTQELNESEAYKARIIEETAKLTAMEDKLEKKSDLIKLKNLVMLNESLKVQESQFKSNCKRQLVALQEELRLSQAGGAADKDELARLQEVEDTHTKILGKYNRLRQMLAERNLNIAHTTRLIDDVPTRTELIQYERRFTELYDQVGLKLEETRKYFDFYNTLDSRREILKKEVKLLSSINENFDIAMRSRASKEEFLKQFEAINKGVEDMFNSKAKVLETKASRLDQLKAEYQSLIDEQRKYFKAVKDFQEECNKNELLSSKLAELETP